MTDEIQYPPGAAYANGAYVAIEDARLSVLDWGFLRSDATYDVAHCIENRFFRLEDHLDRFYRSAEKLRLQIPVAKEECAEIMRECVRRGGVGEAGYVECLVTRGVSPSFSRDPRDAIPTFMVFAIPLGFILPKQRWEEGLHVHISRIHRIPPESVDPTAKNYHWHDLVQGLYEAYDSGAENVVLTDPAGNICEGPGFNVFMVKAGAIATPDRGVLEGISRDTALRLARELDLPVAERAIPAEEFRTADEAFITSTAGGIMPIARVDGTPIGSAATRGRIGPVTQRLRDLYWRKHTDPAWTSPV
jgi:branched-chain amino acid aminotransferase